MAISYDLEMATAPPRNPHLRGKLKAAVAWSSATTRSAFDHRAALIAPEGDVFFPA